MKNPPPIDPKLLERVERDCLKLCRALGYDLNTVEFACENGIPYAIDFMNPAPDADVNSVGQENFDWIVNNVADLAVRKAKEHTGQVAEYRWSAFLNGGFANERRRRRFSQAKPRRMRRPQLARARRAPMHRPAEPIQPLPRILPSLGQCSKLHLNNCVRERPRGNR